MRRSLLQLARRLFRSTDVRSWAAQLSDDEWFKAIDISNGTRNPAHPNIPGLPSSDVQLRFSGRNGTDNLRQAFDFYRFCLRSIGAIGDTGRILDFGCGWGRIARFWLRETDPTRIWCVDAMAAAVDLLRATGIRAHALQCDPVPPIEGLPEHFRLIYAFSVFSHLSEQVALQWMEYFAAHLEPGGYFIFTTRGKQYLADLRHLRMHPPEDAHQTRMMTLAPPQDEIESRYAAGEFVFFGTGGGGELTDDFYGEAIIPEAWLRVTARMGFSSCVLHENVPGVDQAVVILEKK
jgi:hypothetical protein